MNNIRHHHPGTGGGVGGAPVEREWTFMIYLAGDNNLESFGRSDLAEMKTVGSTPQVAIVAQFDQMQGGCARRYYLRRGTSLEADEIPPDLGETNTGDPRILVQFLAWAMETYPAKRYALILWNHGSGWKEDDIYRIVSQSRSNYQTLAGLSIGPLARSFVTEPKRPPLFATTISAILARGIAYDDTAGDFLDNSEMKRALNCSLLAAGVDKFDLLGFDACLMNMLEVAYQVKDVAEYMVGSQDTEPGDGWNYGLVLSQLVERPTMEAEELAAVIVDRYMAAYPPSAQITQSALNLGQIQGVVLALNELCRCVLEGAQNGELAVSRASRRAQRYADPDYKDLYDLCRVLAEQADVAELRQKAQTVMDAIVPCGPGRFIAAEAHRGVRMDRSRGVSIYFPLREMSPYYKRLDFASEALWDDLLHRLFGG